MAASRGVHMLMCRVRAARAFRGSGILGRVDLVEQASECAGQLGIAACLGEQVAERALTQLASVLREAAQINDSLGDAEAEADRQGLHGQGD
jgi:hypothetical protein